MEAHAGEDAPPQFLARLYESCKRVAQDNSDWSAVASSDRLYKDVAPIFSSVVEELTVDRNEFERLSIERLNHISYQNNELAELNKTNTSMQTEDAKLQEDKLHLLQLNTRLREENSHLQVELLKLQEGNARIKTSLLAEEAELEAYVEGQTQQIAELLVERTDLEKALIRYLHRYSDVQSLVRSRRWLFMRLIRLTLRPSMVKRAEHDI